ANAIGSFQLKPERHSILTDLNSLFVELIAGNRQHCCEDLLRIERQTLAEEVMGERCSKTFDIDVNNKILS
ncbi:MAG: hypothetical protein SWJ54_07945, partial [Cyanobacteriota bacterium]|nr:hypothetical protein [Cyanobacteriota bacterium]